MNHTNNDVTKLPHDFDPDQYLMLNPDVAEQGLDPSTHYLAFGRQEGRIHLRESATYAIDPRETINQYGNTSALDANAHVSPKVVAFYLPQYHEIKENNEWWGEGFTEWVNVKRAKPNYSGHYQPHVPLDEDYYDLSNLAVHKRQNDLAKHYGVTAFCYYMYWFDGRRLLERPLDIKLSEKTLDLEFCICWANENWTRAWDGRKNHILLEQVHSLQSDRQFIRSAMKYFSDSRYMRVDGKLMLLVYRVDLLPQCARTAEVWRQEVRAAGLGELHLCAVQFHDIVDPRPYGFDALVEFPPHGWLNKKNLPGTPLKIINRSFRGDIFDYGRAINFALEKEYPDFTWYRGAFPGWDNTARRQDTPHIFANSNSTEFRRWLIGILLQQALVLRREQQIIFINAWNEWGEGAHLEPDQASRFDSLNALSDALHYVKKQGILIKLLDRIRRSTSVDERTKFELELIKVCNSEI